MIIRGLKGHLCVTRIPLCASHRHNFAPASFLFFYVLKGNAFPRGDNSRKYYRCDIFYIIHEIVLSIMGHAQSS